MRLPLLIAVIVLASASLARADTTINLSGTIVADGGPIYTLVPFAVPTGTAEIQIHHQLLQPDGGTDILDFGLWDANGYRGWGGGNTEDIVVGQLASSRSYHPGDMPVGTWNVVIGAALVTENDDYALTITLRDTATLPPDTSRTTYTPVAALKSTAGWYAGDFHVHDSQSGDARPTLTTVATVAQTNGLDFVELSDHNVDSQVDLIPQVQAQFPNLLIMPGDELTTYSGHANGIGATRYVDHRLTLNGRTASAAFDDLHAEGALVSINHPVLDLGNLCLGCEWRNDDVQPDQVDGVEIENGGWNEVGSLFGNSPVAFWETWLNAGRHVAALGGSDDHRAGIDEGSFGSAISHPTTMVYATELSVAGIMAGIRAGHTVVKLEGVSDPMIDLTSGTSRAGDTIAATSAPLSAVITGGMGQTAHWVQNGVAQTDVDVTSDPFTLQTTITAPSTGEDRWRAEVVVDGSPRTITSHIWITLPAPSKLPAEMHGCASSEGGSLLALAILVLGLRRRRYFSLN